MAKLDVPCLGAFGRPTTDGERERFERLPDVQLEEWTTRASGGGRDGWHGVSGGACPRPGAGDGRCRAGRPRRAHPPAAGVRRSASVQHLTAHGAHPPLRIGAGPRCLHGRAQHLDPRSGKDASNPAVHLVSRSGIRNPNRLAWSPGAMIRLRACWVTHGATGCAVTPSRWTRRVATSMADSTYGRLRHTVSTVKKSMASTLSAWARRNRRQLSADRVGAGAPRRVGGESTGSRGSAVTGGRPQRWGEVQRRRTRSRCQRDAAAAGAPGQPAPHGRPSPCADGQRGGAAWRPHDAGPDQSEGHGPDHPRGSNRPRNEPQLTPTTDFLAPHARTAWRSPPRKPTTVHGYLVPPSPVELTTHIQPRSRR
jgi:hypothetical protein